MKVSDLNFNVELKSTHAMHTRFPRENCAGIALTRPNPDKKKYRLKITLQEDTAKQAGITPHGYAMAKLSDCSNGLQVLWELEQGERFKGYRMRPSGAYNTEEQVKAVQKSRNTPYMNCYVEISIDFNQLDTKKTNKFDLKYVDIIHVGKHQVVVDISELRIYVAKRAHELELNE